LFEPLDTLRFEDLEHVGEVGAEVLEEVNTDWACV
jgi:hypothetical protein